MRAFVLLRQHLTDYKDLKNAIIDLEKEMNLKETYLHLITQPHQPSSAQFSPPTKAK